MADTIRNENEEKKIKVKAPVTAKKNKQHQTSNCDIFVMASVTEIDTEIDFKEYRTRCQV